MRTGGGILGEIDCLSHDLESLHSDTVAAKSSCTSRHLELLRDG